MLLLLLIVGLVPSLAFYAILLALTAFALGRCGVKRFRRTLAAVLVALAAYFAPVPGNVATAERVDQQFARRVLPDSRIRLHGDIRLETVEYHPSMSPIEELPEGPWEHPSGSTAPIDGDYAHARGCGRFCVILLHTEGVESVTVESPSVRPLEQGPSPFAATYRLASSGACTAPMGTDQFYFGADIAEEALKTLWAGITKAPLCLRGEAPLKRYDYLLRGTRTNFPPTSGRTGADYVELDLAPRPVNLWMFEIFDAQRRTLLRELSVDGSRIVQPLIPSLNLAGRGPIIGFFATSLYRGPPHGSVVIGPLRRSTNARLPAGNP